MNLRMAVLLGTVWGCTSAALQGQELMSTWLKPDVGNMASRVDHESRGSFNEEVSDQDARMQMTEHDLRLLLPVWQNDTDELFMTGRIKSMHFDTDARLPPQRRWKDPETWWSDDFPEHLWDLRVGVGYRHAFANGWLAGMHVEVGSPSDRPFNSMEETALNLNGFLRVPSGRKDAWVFLLNYASNREFLAGIPIPGVAYEWNPNADLQALLGLPASNVRYRPVQPILIEASYFVPRTVNAKVSLIPIEPVKLYAGFDWRNHRYFRHARQDDDDRLFYDEKRVFGGVRWDITSSLYIDLGGGYAFDRFWFEGEDYGDRGDRRLDLSDGPYLAASIGLRF